jgi:hypothetical protein
LKKGIKIAKIIVQMIAHTKIITNGSIAVQIFFEILSNSFLYFFEIFNNNLSVFQVSSQIFTTEANSIGK